MVKPNFTQRRAAWHGDSYRRKKEKHGIDVDHIYVACNTLPTLFTKATFDFVGVDIENLEEVLNHFNSDILHNNNIITYPAYTLLKLDPYVVHNCSINNSTDDIYRCFVRITISTKQYSNKENSHNDLFDYSWKKTIRWDRQKGAKK
jgi:hypothetical protein